MSELRRGAPPGRDALRRGLANQLSRRQPPLRVLAEELLGLDSSIDLVAVDAQDRVVLVLISEDAGDLGLFTRGLAQRAWVAARLPDWLKLAPALALRADAPLRVLLLAPDHAPATRAAAASLEPGSVELARYRWLRDGARDAVWIETLEPEAAPGLRPAPAPSPGKTPPPAPQPPTARRPEASTPVAPPPAFRSGLTEQDFGFSPEELRELG